MLVEKIDGGLGVRTIRFSDTVTLSIVLKDGRKIQLGSEVLVGEKKKLGVVIDIADAYTLKHREDIFGIAWPDEHQKEPAYLSAQDFVLL